MFIDSDEDENKAFAVQHDNSMRTMSAKVAPSYNGNTSWFQYEELIDEWCDLTTIEASKRGPNLKSRLFGEAQFLKALLEGARLKDEDTGVHYFKDTLRPNFIKNKEHVFLWRFLKLFSFRRGHSDITQWAPRFLIVKKRLLESWMDLFEPVTNKQDADYRDAIAAFNQRTLQRAQDDFTYATNAAWNNQGQMPVWNPPDMHDPDADESLKEYNDKVMKPQHAAQFPLNEQLLTLMFIVSAELNEAQRESLLRTFLT